MTNPWHIKYLRQAREISTWSKDPSTKVGAVICGPDYQPISQGYNGFAQGVADRADWLEDRSIKYLLMLHAEENALLFADQIPKGSSIFTYPFQPCAHCMSMILQKGIRTVVTVPLRDTEKQLRWGDNFKLATKILCEAGGNIYTYDKNMLEPWPEWD